MSQSAIRQALTGHITSLGLTNKINWPNQANWVTPSNELWLRVAYLLGEKSQLTLRETDQLDGVVAIDIFAPKSSGTIASYTIADQLDALFSRLNPIERNGVTIHVRSVQPITPQDDDPWWRSTFRATIRCYMNKL